MPRVSLFCIFLPLTLVLDAQAASRELPAHYVPGVGFSVVITLDAPKGAGVVAIEDAPPATWPASNISDGGTLDVQTGKIKWGPFFGGSIPAEVGFDVTPAATGAVHCFSGAISVDGDDQPIGGDDCVLTSVPAVSDGGLVMTFLLLLCIAALAVRKARLRAAIPAR